VFGIWLALPFALIWLWQSPRVTFGKCFIEPEAFRCFALMLGLGVLFLSLASAWHYTYLDSNNRLAMRYSLGHPLLAGTHTTAERARVVQELLDATPRFIRSGDEVLAYNAVPLVHFLTKTHPWLGCPWPDFVSPRTIAAQLREKERAGAELPCIVRAIQSTYTTTWPTTPQPLSTWEGQDKVRRLFAEFEQRHGYVVAWSNDFFEILTP
jgi:hypothetical protein